VRGFVPRAAWLPWVLAAAAAGCLGACGGGPAADPGREAVLEASPVVLGGQNGLEVQYWVATGDGDAMFAAFAEFQGAEVPVDEAVRDVLARNGLRLLAVPVDRLSEVQSRLSVIGAVQRQWLGQAPGWIDIATGPLRERGQTIALHDGVLRVGPGRLRILLRGWTVPVPPGVAPGNRGAAMDVEIVPQHQEMDPRGELSLTPRRIAPEDEGLVFTRLAARMRLHGDVAVVIVPERPGVTWEARKEEPPAESQAAPDVAAGPAPRPAPGLGQVSRVEAGRAAPVTPEVTASPAPAATLEQGPPSAPLPSLGEAMLMSRADLPGPDGAVSGRARSRTVRAVVVLVPRVPDRFELLGSPR